MNYKNVIEQQYIEDYKELHRIFYSTLSSMIFDMSFLRECVNLQDSELRSDWISVKCLHRDLFENLVSKIYRCFFDNTGSDSTNIFNYKNRVIGVFLKEEYRQEVKDNVATLDIMSLQYKPSLERLKENVVELRNGFIGHRLLSASDVCEVDLNDIQKLVEYACELFQALSFEPRDFYSFIEGDGHDFSKEFAFTESLCKKFITNTFLTSKYITKINCEFDESCPEEIRNRLEKIIQSINTDR